MPLIVGLDLAQSNDYTATAIIEHRLARSRPDAFGAAVDERLAVVHLARTRGQPYPTIVADTVALLLRPELAGARLVIDATGVGAPVVDLFTEAGVRPFAITLHAGDAVTRDDYAHGGGGLARVPKRDIVSGVQVRLQNGQLVIASGLEHAATLASEMVNFRAKISAGGADTYSSWRERAHDDLVLAVSLACWYAGNPAPDRTLHVY